MKRYLFLLTTLCLLAFLTKTFASAVPDKLIGNWFDTAGKDYWEYGITQDFIVSNHTFWAINHVWQEGNTCHFSLENKGKKRQLSFQLLNDSTISKGGARYTKNFRSIRRKAQNQPLSLQPGTAIINGYIRHFKRYADSTDQIKFIVNDFVRGKQTSYFARIDSQGRFQATIPLHSPQDVYFQYLSGGPLPRLFLVPGNTLTLFTDAESVDKSTDETQFMGRYADINYDLYYMHPSHQANLPSLKEYTKALGSEPEQYVLFRKDWRRRELAFLEDYCAQHTCSDGFQLWFRKHTEVEYFTELMKFTWQSTIYGMGSATRLTGEKGAVYRAYYDSIHLDDSYYRISSDYLHLINELRSKRINFVKISEVLQDKQFNFNLKMRIFLAHQAELMGKDVSLLKALYLCNILESPLDSLQQAQFWKLADQYEDEIQSVQSQQFIHAVLDSINTLTSVHLRDLLMCQALYQAGIEAENPVISDFVFDKIRNRITDTAYFKVITQEYNTFRDPLQHQAKASATAFKSAKDGEALWNEILQRNQGKAIYLDFWASWCGPCQNDFSEMKPIKETLSGKDISFVYLCCQSTQTHWSAVLNKFDVKGQHYLLTRKQYDDLQERFALSSFPTYLLVAKDGKIATKLPRPDASGNLLKILTKAAEK